VIDPKRSVRSSESRQEPNRESSWIYSYFPWNQNAFTYQLINKKTTHPLHFHYWLAICRHFGLHMNWASKSHPSMATCISEVSLNEIHPTSSVFNHISYSETISQGNLANPGNEQLPSRPFLSGKLLIYQLVCKRF